ncbi:MAG: hypothetical protein J0652_02565 [Desulfobulbaceae bacterium]|nr:hypothetical protein [Desulfobulbaceae bacterium]
MDGLHPSTTNNEAQLFLLGLPPEQDVGYITRDSSVPIYLWNGSAAEATLTGVSSSGDTEGIAWDAAPPELLGPKRSLRVIFTVGIDGPLTFSADIAFASTCNTTSLNLYGLRAPQLAGDIGLLFHPHNWEDGWNESYEWKTDVMIAWNRTEQRVQLRTAPRRRFDLRLLVAGDSRRKLETTMGQRKSVYMFAPIWRDGSRLDVVLPANSSVIPVAESTDNYVVGTPVAIWTDADTFEYREISGVGAGFVAVGLPFIREWPVGANVAPCRYCLCSGGRSVNRFTEDVGEYKLQLLMVEDKWAPTAAIASETYQGLPIFPLPASWGEQGQGYDNKWTLLDNDTGIIEVDVQSSEPVFERELKILVWSRDRISRMLAFIAYCAGRKSPFWVAADDRGFELAVPAPNGQNYIVIKPINYAFSLTDSNARAHIEMIMTDGTIIRRQIIGVETLPSYEEKLILDSALPVAISAEILNRCAWLEKVRLNTDSIDLSWLDWQCVEAGFPVVVLP